MRGGVGHLIVFDRAPQRSWDEKIFPREPPARHGGAGHGLEHGSVRRYDAEYAGGSHMQIGSARLQTGLVTAVIATGLLATAQPARAQEEASAAPTDSELRPLALEQLQNAEYHLPLLDGEETPIRLHGGQGSLQYGTGATQRVHAGLVDDLVAFGDLDGDLVVDAAAVVFIDPGGSGTFIHLLAMQDREGTPVQAAREFLGDRVRVQGISISGGRIFVTVLAHGPGDGLCFPSIEATRAFTLRGPRLVPSQLLVIESPLPGETVATGVAVRGTASTHPSADGLAYLVYDARGGVIGMGEIPVAADSGNQGTFAAPVSFLAGAGGPGRIEIVDVHRDDGSAMARASVQVRLEASDAARRPVPQEIVLETPLSGATVGRHVELRGWISTAPFENNLTYRVYSEGGMVIDQGWIMVEGALGARGTFAKSITLPSAQPAGPVRIEFRDDNEADGSLFASTTVQVLVVLPGSPP